VTTPFQGQFVVRRLKLAMTNLHTKLQVSVHPLRRYERQCKMQNMAWFGRLAVTKDTGNVTIR